MSNRSSRGPRDLSRSPDPVSARPPPVQEVSPARGAGLGTFGGVFTPSILTILGVIMYLRFGWVVGNVGLPATLLIVTISTSITFLTALSISAIATDQRVRVGGAYYMVSRSLGIETGGAVGIPLFFAQALSVALYTVGFAEAVSAAFPVLPARPVGLVTTVLVGLLALRSARVAIRAQYFIMATGCLSSANLPDIDGREVCRMMRKCGVKCPVVMLTGHDTDADTILGLDSGAIERLTFDNYSIDTVGQQIKAVDVPDEFEEKPRILVFACENDTAPAIDMLAMERIRLSPYVRIIPLRCLGGVNLVWVSDALSRGFDGVMFMGCQYGDDYQCHFVKGSERANVRLSKVEETLSRLMLEPERVRQYEVSMNDYRQVAEMIERFAADIDDYGPNPFKGM